MDVNWHDGQYAHRVRFALQLSEFITRLGISLAQMSSRRLLTDALENILEA